MIIYVDDMIVTENDPNEILSIRRHLASDVWGPAPLPTYNGMQWFVTLMDDYTRMTWLYLLKNAKVMRVMFFKYFTK